MTPAKLRAIVEHATAGTDDKGVARVILAVQAAGDESVHQDVLALLRREKALAADVLAVVRAVGKAWHAYTHVQLDRRAPANAGRFLAECAAVARETVR